MRKSISDVTIIKILKKPTSQKYLQRTVFYIYIFLILIVHECFTAEELDNFLFTIFTFRRGQNGGKIIGTFKKRAPLDINWAGNLPCDRIHMQRHPGKAD